jgi:Flp pilus assembly pilin Flp
MMPYWKAAALRFLGNRSGQDMIEYALVAGFVAVAAAAIFPATLMPNVSMIFSKLDIYFAQAASQGTGS